MILKSISFLILFFTVQNIQALPMNGLTNLEGKPGEFKTDKNTELVVFWATWCPDCKTKITNELPKVEASKDIAVVLINTEKEADRVKKYLEKQDIKMTVFMDSEKALRKELKVFSVPAWAVYKREGKDKPWALVDSASAFENEKVNKALGRKVF